MRSPVFRQKMLRQFLVNGQLGDPALYNFCEKTGQAALFDLGSLADLSPGELYKVRWVFISHTHLDHFIGFDQWLRVHVPHGRWLGCAGAKGLAQQIQCRLRSYTWNLLDKDQIKIIVREIDHQGMVTSFLLRNTTCFEIESYDGPGLQHSDNSADHGKGLLAVLDDGSKVYGLPTDHKGIISVAFLWHNPVRFRLLVDECQRLGLTPGPWVKSLQIALVENQYHKKLRINDQVYQVKELAALVLEPLSTKAFVYLTDCLFTQKLVDDLVSFADGVDRLYGECNYRACDQHKAQDKAHLTTQQAAFLAAALHVDEFIPFHISKIYKDSLDDVLAEAQQYFEQYRQLDCFEYKKLLADLSFC